MNDHCRAIILSISNIYSTDSYSEFFKFKKDINLFCKHSTNTLKLKYNIQYQPFEWSRNNLVQHLINEIFD